MSCIVLVTTRVSIIAKQHFQHTRSFYTVAVKSIGDNRLVFFFFLFSSTRRKTILSQFLCPVSWKKQEETALRYTIERLED